MKLIRLSGIIVLFGLWLTGVIAQEQNRVADEVLRLVNEARQDAGIHSLIASPELTVAAQRHSADLALTGELSHTGSDGSEFWERMQDAGYVLSAGGENVLFRFDTVAASVFAQWWDSPPHQANMMNPDYVEIGIAYAEASDGSFYFTMLLGARPDITPPPVVTNPPPPTQTPTVAITQPTATPEPPVATPQPTLTPVPVILSPTVSSAFSTNTPVPTATPAVVSTATPQPVPDIRLEYDDSRLTLINIAGRELNLQGLVFNSESGQLPLTAWVPYLQQPLTSFPAGDCIQVMVSATSGNPITPSSCNTMKSWLVVFNDSEDFWRETPVFSVFNEDIRVGVCDVTAGQCEFSLSGVIDDTTIETVATQNTLEDTQPDVDLRLLYDERRFSLINVSGRELNLEGLEFVSASGNLSSFRWSPFASPLSRFPDSYCLQAVIRGSINEPLTPPGCNLIRGWLVLYYDNALFWQNSSLFSVNYNDVRVGVCDITASSCEISLSDNFGAASRPENATLPTTLDTSGSSVAGQGTSDIRLLISNTGVTLINTSGGNINLSGLAFESEGGVMAASAWNIAELSRPLSDFTSGDCLQVLALNEEYESPSEQCNVRHAWIFVGTDRQFWRNAASFSVLNNQQVLATCQTENTVCDINFSG